MFFGLALEIESTIEHLSAAVAQIDSDLEIFFSNKDYGSDVENIYVGVIATDINSEKLHPIRRFKYQKLIKVKIPGRVLEKKNVIQYDIKPDYGIFSQMNVRQARQHIAKLIFDSTRLIEKHHPKFPNFDLLHFKEDLRNCLGLISRSESDIID